MVNGMLHAPASIHPVAIETVLGGTVWGVLTTEGLLFP
jgi:hypothetical protein